MNADQSAFICVNPRLNNSLWIYGEARLDPCLESAVQRMHVFPTAISEFLRHTGAGRFVRSSAVGYDCAVFWYFVDMLRDFIGGDANSVRQFPV